VAKFGIGKEFFGHAVVFTCVLNAFHCDIFKVLNVVPYVPSRVFATCKEPTSMSIFYYYRHFSGTSGKWWNRQ